MLQTALFRLIAARTEWLGSRFTVLAENIANADTPGYRARDLAARDFARLLEMQMKGRGGTELRRTHPRHLAAPAPRIRVRPVEVRPFEVTPSGNAVSLAEETRKMAETQKDYLLAINLFAKYRAMFERVLGSGA